MISNRHEAEGRNITANRTILPESSRSLPSQHREEREACSGCHDFGAYAARVCGKDKATLRGSDHET